jgi:hypothetical protein
LRTQTTTASAISISATRKRPTIGVIALPGSVHG